MGRWKKEVEALRQELMDYVRFIVHILPENWAETDAADKVPEELREQLSWMPASKNATPITSPAKRGGGRGKSNPTTPKGFLPPTDILAKGVAFGGQYAGLETVPIASPHKHGAEGILVDGSF